MKNRVTLLGYLGQDPDVRQLDNGTKVARLSVATSESWKKEDGTYENKTTWHTVIAWRGAAKYAEKHLSKGHMVDIEGKITYRSYQDDQGNKKQSTEIVSTNLIKLEKRNRDDGFDRITERDAQIDFLRGNTKKAPTHMDGVGSDGFTAPVSQKLVSQAVSMKVRPV